MKMRKYLALGLSVLVIIAMVGCSSKNTPENISKNNNLQDESKKVGTSEEITYLGKVKKIVGNEIEIELAKDQDIPEDQDVPGDTPTGFESKTVREEGGKKYAPSKDLGDDVVVDDVSYADNEKLELEYTGETIKFTIPTGANVFDIRSRSDSKLSAIKTNSIIKIFATGTKESPVVKSIDIVE